MVAGPFWRSKNHAHTFRQFSNINMQLSFFGIIFSVLQLAKDIVPLYQKLEIFHLKD